LSPPPSPPSQSQPPPSRPPLLLDGKVNNNKRKRDLPSINNINNDDEYEEDTTDDDIDNIEDDDADMNELSILLDDERARMAERMTDIRPKSPKYSPCEPVYTPPPSSQLEDYSPVDPPCPSPTGKIVRKKN
jgi:hypothetical protein